MATIFFLTAAFAATLETNELVLRDSPGWVDRGSVTRAINRVERFMEWDLRKVEGRFVPSEEEFRREHHLGPGVAAFSDVRERRIVFGPETRGENFEEILGHELVHQVIAQKFKKAIPKWLEEGLANFVGRTPHSKPVRYAWLVAQPAFDVRALEHPFLRSVVNPSVHYEASTALAEMLQKRCGLIQLVQLSVGKNLDSYLSTFCDIPDLNGAYREWIRKQAS